MTQFPTMEEVRKLHFIAVLDACRGNRSETARVLGISLRTVTTLIRQYGLPRNSKPAWLVDPVTTDGRTPTEGPIS